MKKAQLTIVKPSPKRLKSSFLSQITHSTKNETIRKFKPVLATPKHSVKPEIRKRETSSKASGQRGKRKSMKNPVVSKVPSLALAGVKRRQSQVSTSRVRHNSLTIETTKDLNSTVQVKREPQSLRGKSSRKKLRTQTLLKRNSLSTSKRQLPKAEFPMTPSTALQLFSKELTSFEQTEILNYSRVFFLGQNAPKIKPRIADKNNGYDDERSDYKIVKGDHIAYRYEILGTLGSGSFGKVLKVKDHKDNKEMALKIIRNKNRFHQQGAVEIKVLKYLRDKDSDSSFNVVHMKDHFPFRRHICITFELLSLNLFDFLQKNDFQGLSLKLIRRFAAQILHALRAQEKFGIIHCDLKPENILLKHSNQSALKVIDYGSACFENEKIYTYIQSRFYRAPEIMLGIEYTTKIDMWSFGCILAELYTGYPLFPGECEAEQLYCIIEVLGLPPSRVLEKSTRKKVFFDGDQPVLYTNSRGKTRQPQAKSLTHILQGADPSFVALIRACLEWNPEDRISAKDALTHEWIVANDPLSTSRGSSLQPHQGSKHPRKASLESDFSFKTKKGKTSMQK